MNLSVADIGDLSNNKFAAVMRQLAEGFSGWAGLLLLPFLIYRIVANDAASLVSLKALLVIVGGDLAFVIAAKVANVLLASVLAVLIAPLVMKQQIEIAQNVQNTILAIFGLFLCFAAWFYATYAVHYAYS
jgi:hypothetical protein